MKYYKLLKDLPTFKAGDIFELDEDDGGLYWRRTSQIKEKGGHWMDRVPVYNRRTLYAFPDILEDWFEETETPGRLMNAWRGSDVYSSGNMLYLEFSTSTAAKKALKKVEALERLKACGFKFTNWVRTSRDGNAELSMLASVKEYMGFTEDLDLLFGGEK